MDVKKSKSVPSFALSSYLLFLISPFLALPAIWFNIYQQKRGAMFCLAMFMGIVSYLILPDWSLDLARYYQYYDLLANFSFYELVYFLSIGSDYIFYIVLFLSAKIGFKFQILLFLMSTFNFYVIFSLYKQIADRFLLSKRTYFYFFVVLFLSIGMIYYLSATRFVLASSFFMLFLNSFYIKKRKIPAYFWLIVTLLTHISFFIFVPILFFISWFKSRRSVFFMSVVLAFLGVLVPISFILGVLNAIVPQFVAKTEIYLTEDRLVNIYPLISYYTTLVLTLFFLGRSYVTLKLEYYKWFMITFLAVLITLPFGYLVYDRYMILFKPILVLVMTVGFAQSKKGSRSKILFLSACLILPFLLHFAYSLYLYRANFVGFLSLDSLWLYSILEKSYTLKDIFDL